MQLRKIGGKLFPWLSVQVFKRESKRVLLGQKSFLFYGYGENLNGRRMAQEKRYDS